MPKLTKAVTARFTTEEFETLNGHAQRAGQCPAEWLRGRAVERMGMSREVIETRAGVSTIAELLVHALPDKLPVEFVRKTITRNRAEVAKGSSEGGK